MLLQFFWRKLNIAKYFHSKSPVHGPQFIDIADRDLEVPTEDCQLQTGE